MADATHLVVLGNGFDIDCGLPTQYGDFLDFISLLRDLEGVADLSLRVGSIDAWCSESGKNRVREGLRGLLKDAFCTSADALMEWRVLTGKNPWIDYFTHVRSRRMATIGENWVDFESEIAEVVAELESSMLHEPGAPLTFEDSVRFVQDRRYDKLMDMLLVLGQRYGLVFDREIDHNARRYDASYADVKKRLCDGLNCVRLALQKYLRDFVEKASPHVTSGAKRLCDELVGATHRYVVSFNYTHTFERVFSKRHPAERGSVRYCYLHGEVLGPSSECNMVLGINEYRTGKKASEHLEFIEFRKFFQRIYHANDTKYLLWAKEFEGRAKRGEELRMSIYGHSLAVTDKDVLSRLILCAGMKTTSYYHSREALAQQIANAVALIGADEVIARTGDDAKSLEFKRQ